MDRAARFVKPMMLREAPGARLQGARATSPRSLREAGRMAGFSKREIHELVRVFTMSVGDLLDDYFELDGLKGSTASSGVVGVWAGPAHARHRLQPPPPRARRVRRDRGRLGPGDRRHGRDQRGDRRAPPQRRAPRSSPAPRSPRSTSATAPRSASRSPTAPSCAPRSSPPARTRRRPSSSSPGPRTSPAEIGEDMARYRTRGASVKVNLLLSEPPGLRGRHRSRSSS